MNNISYRKLKKDEIKLSLFSNFDRHQEVNKCWRKENKKWILKNISFTENWGIDEYEFLVKCLQKTIKTGGTVFGTFKGKNLVGFASLENHFFGSKNNYLQLSSIHASNNYRGQGIGKSLFKLVCKKAKDAGAEKLYISAHSAEETQLFYKAMGCQEAVEYNEKLVAKEPYDCQLEYIL
ncbi:GNAT family N-acetyltransferase [Halanaerobium sp.]|uniref:GNAT family N-acetyltransferase n=1 Tax=Halanaerobium sp. TaxID=1895664 RepID=UPI000DE7B870|nr:GNAT family N-acetyltransferase [Halanaerobium sp.]PUU90185.1 MAG: N-acetyltransferase GCN5 [Halanaerobium sp.]